MSQLHPEQLKIVTATTAEEGPLLQLEGELVLATAEPLRERLRGSEHRRLTLDLSGLTFTDSSGLATLIEARLRAMRQGAQLRIRGARGQTRTLLERTGVLRMFGDSPGEAGVFSGLHARVDGALPPE
jgi:anti-sigma B factor antagonist